MLCLLWAKLYIIVMLNMGRWYVPPFVLTQKEQKVKAVYGSSRCGRARMAKLYKLALVSSISV